MQTEDKSMPKDPIVKKINMYFGDTLTQAY